MEPAGYVERRNRTAFGKIILWLFWIFNLAMLAWLCTFFGKASELHQAAASSAEGAGVAIGTAFGTTMLLAVWLLGDLILGIAVISTRGTKTILPASAAVERKLVTRKATAVSAIVISLILFALIAHNTDKQKAADNPGPSSNNKTADKVSPSLPANWEFSSKLDPITDKPIAGLFIKSGLAPVEFSDGLVIQCMEGKFDLSIHSLVPFTIKRTLAVTTRVGQASAETSNWQMGSTHTDAFSVSPEKFAKSLLGQNTLAIRTTVLDGSTKDLNLNIQNIDPYIAQIAEACHTSIGAYQGHI